MIAINNSNGGFHPRWIEYCKGNNIPYKLVNCYSDNIVEQLEECDGLMWHHSQSDPRDVLAAKRILYALQHSGKKVFPDFNTGWHFDDKAGQKYLIELLEIPTPKTHVFYNKEEALNWAKNTEYPTVSKLKGGAGSANVKLVKNYKEAKRIINKAFTKGIKPFNGWNSFIEVRRKYKLGIANNKELIKSIYRIFIEPAFSKVMGREAGYVYFQEYIPYNKFDIRIIIINDKAFAIKRMIRERDFRASGSGNIKYERENFNVATLKMAFFIADKVKSQCLAMDFVYKDKTPLLVEISFGFVKEVYDPCTGYWDRDLKFYPGKFNPYGWMVEGMINIK